MKGEQDEIWSSFCDQPKEEDKGGQEYFKLYAGFLWRGRLLLLLVLLVLLLLLPHRELFFNHRNKPKLI